jgi:hypothetical protein
MNTMICQPTSTDAILNSAWCAPTWKQVDNFSNYWVCKHGTVVSSKRKTVHTGFVNGEELSFKMNSIMTGANHSCGYRNFQLTNDDGQHKNMLGHRLTAIAFQPNPENHDEVDHINRNKLDNSVYNLRWISHAENQINTPLYKRKNKNDGFRHIVFETKNNREYFTLQINRNKVRIVNKRYNCKKYTLDQVVQIRNQFYKKHGIDIDDN